MQGLVKKLIDNDFLSLLSNFDIILLSETWHSKLSNLQIDNYEYFSCPRPVFHKNAKRNSGGLVVYYHKSLSGKIELKKLEPLGFMIINRAGTIQSVSVHNRYRHQPIRIDTAIMLYRYN